MDAFELFNEKGSPTGVWCCGKCRKLVLNPVCIRDHSAPKSTREAAELCCTAPKCPKCGCEDRKKFYDHWPPDSTCMDCDSEERREEFARRNAELLETAEDVTESYTGGIVWSEEFHGSNDGMFQSVDDFIDTLANEDKDCLFDGDTYIGPTAVFASEVEPKRLDIWRSIEWICEEGYEDMELHLTIPESLKSAEKEFNEINAKALQVYSPDHKRKVRLIGIEEELRTVFFESTGKAGQ